MGKYKVLAKEAMDAYPHTWTKGLDYEVIEKENSITVTSNEGQLNYVNDVKAEILAKFTRVE